MLDYSALESPADPAEVRAFAEWARDPGRVWEPMQPVVFNLGTVLRLVAAYVALPLLALVPFVYVGILWENAYFYAIVPFGLVIVGVGIGLIALRSRTRAPGVGWEQMYRLHEFADDNNLAYSPRDDAPESYVGALFDHHGQVYSHLSARSGRFFDFGSYRYAITELNGQPVYVHRGYIAVQLDKHLPQITLDATANAGTLFNREIGGDGQRVRLEGDFDDYFTLHCPAGYESDALYVLTPDLMALLIDQSHACDVEIIENWMFIYSVTPFDLTEQAVLDRIIRILGTVGVSAAHRSTNYRDERLRYIERRRDRRPARYSRGTRLRYLLQGWLGLALVVALFAGFVLFFATAGGR